MGLRWVAGAALLALAGCVSEPRYAEAPGSGYDPRYQGYWSADERADDEAEAADDYLPEYLEWPEYYSVLWPVYQYTYDPWFNPWFYYGVTYFPSTWFGVGYDDPYAWAYYVPYSPYLYSPWDNYYVWYGGGHHHGHDRHGHDRHHRDHEHGRDHDGGQDDDHDGYAHDGRHHRGEHPPGQGAAPRPRFGSDTNQAQRLTDLNQAQRMRRGPEWRVRQNRPGSDGFPEPTAQDRPGPAPKPGTSERRTKPRAVSGDGWTAARDRPPGASEPRAYVARPPARYRYDDPAPRRSGEPREGVRLGSAPVPRVSAPEGFASDSDAPAPSSREEPRARMPAFDTSAPPRGERNEREQPRMRGPMPEAPDRRTVERQPRAPVAAPYAAPAPGPYAGAAMPAAPTYAAPRAAPQPYAAPPPTSAPPARAPTPATADRPTREDVRGAGSAERNR